MDAPTFPAGRLARLTQAAPVLLLGGALCLALPGCGGGKQLDDPAGAGSNVGTAADRNSPTAVSGSLDGDGRSASLDGDARRGGDRDDRDARRGSDARRSAPAGEPLTLLYPTGERSSSSLLVRKQLPREVGLDKPFDYTITVENLTDEPIDGVVLNEPVPAHMTIESASPQPSSESGGQATWNLNLGPKASQTINVTAVATEAKPIRQCSTVSYDPTLCSQLAVVSPSLNLAVRAPRDDAAVRRLRGDLRGVQQRHRHRPGRGDPRGAARGRAA